MNLFIKIICKILNILIPKIKIIEMEYNGYYIKEIDTVFININLNYYEKLFLIAHELRHKYQLFYIDMNNNLTSIIWRYEFLYYDLLDYKNLYIEIDAYTFSLIIMKLFNINYDPSMEVKEMILNGRIKK